MLKFASSYSLFTVINWQFVDWLILTFISICLLHLFLCVCSTYFYFNSLPHILPALSILIIIFEVYVLIVHSNPYIVAVAALNILFFCFICLGCLLVCWSMGSILFSTLFVVSSYYVSILAFFAIISPFCLFPIYIIL